MLYLPNFIGKPLMALIYLAATILILFCIWLFFRGKNYFIEHIIIPFYDELEKKYNAKYPTVMVNLISNSYYIGSIYSDSDTFFFISNSSFHIISKSKSSVHIEIPFESITYIRYIRKDSGFNNYTYEYHFKFLSNENETIEFNFSTLNYNHKLDKKYGDRLNGQELFNFIRENGIDPIEEWT